LQPIGHSSSTKDRRAGGRSSTRLRIMNTRMGQALIAELNGFEVDFTSAGNTRVDVRSKDHHGDFVIATALAEAVGEDRGQYPRTPSSEPAHKGATPPLRRHQRAP
jgi:hypothetical protein